jgi:hypothetical protein
MGGCTYYAKGKMKARAHSGRYSYYSPGYVKIVTDRTKGGHE